MPPRPPVLAMLAVLACARAHRRADRSRVLDLARARRGSVAAAAAAAAHGGGGGYGDGADCGGGAQTLSVCEYASLVGST